MEWEKKGEKGKMGIQLHGFRVRRFVLLGFEVVFIVSREVGKPLRNALLHYVILITDATSQL